MKKTLTGFLCVLLAITLLPITGLAMPKPTDTESEEYVTVIVEVNGDAVLETQSAKALGYKKYLG